MQNDVGCASLGGDGCKGVEYPVLWNETSRNSPGISYTPNEDLCATIDTGCQRMAIGLNTLKRLDQALPAGLQTSIVPQEHRFRSVHGTSTTKYVAAIPTSLGHRGSLLRPAVFETSASRDAPFLISLPFLMFCHSVLHLDPSFELRVEFRRFKFSAPCHIGPTGSLRVSLADFSSENIRRLKKAQVEFQGREKEFEIFRLSSAFGPIPEVNESNFADSPSPTCHGEPRNYQESSCGQDRDGERAGVEAHGPEVALPGVSHHGHGDPTSATQGEEQDPAILGMATERDSRGEGHQRCGELGKLYDGEIYDRGAQSDTTIPNSQLRVADHGRPESRDTGRDRDHGHTSDLQPSSTLHPLYDPEAGVQLREDVLALSAPASTTMQILRMDSIPTQLEGTSGELSQHRDTSHPDIAEGTYDTREEEACSQVQSLPHDKGRHQRLCGPGEVRDLWRDSTERGTSGFRDGVQSILQVEQGQDQRDQGEEGALPEGDGQGGVGGVRGVPEVSPVADAQEGSEERGPGQLQTEGRFVRLRPPDEGDVMLEGATELTKQARRAVHQAEAALRTAEETWRELMSLVCTESDQTEPTGWKHFQHEVLDPKDPSKVRNAKALRKFASLLGTDKDQAK